jgi:hypothetical protein
MVDASSEVTFRCAVVRSFATGGWPLGAAVVSPNRITLRPGFSSTVEIDRQRVAAVVVRRLRMPFAWSTYFVIRLADGSAHPRMFVPYRSNAVRSALTEVSGWSRTGHRCAQRARQFLAAHKCRTSCLRHHGGVRNRIVEGDDYSVLPVPMVQILRALRRVFGRRGPGADQQVGVRDEAHPGSGEPDADDHA